MTRLKKLFYLYQRAFWYIGIAKGELLKPLGFWNETLLVVTYLTVRGMKTTVIQIITAYVLIMIVGTIVGKVIILLGIPKYNNKIANHQNDEIMEIINSQKEINSKLDKIFDELQQSYTIQNKS